MDESKKDESLDEVTETSDEETNGNQPSADETPPQEISAESTETETEAEPESAAEEEKIPESESEAATDLPQAENEEQPSEIPAEKKKKGGIKAVCGKFTAAMEKLGLPDMALPRLIAAYFIVSGMNVHELRNADPAVNAIRDWQTFVGDVMIFSSIMLLFGIFAVLTVLYSILPRRLRIFDQSTAILSVLYFDMVLLWRGNDFFLSIGVMALSLVFIYYCWGKLKSKKLMNKLSWISSGLIVLASAVLVCFFVSITTVCRHRNFGSATHDFGLFVQMYHSLAENLTAVTTSERDKPLSHFYVHSSFIFYLLVPFYKIWPKEETLLISQAVLAMGGVIPFFLIAKRHKMKGVTLMFMGLAYVFSAALIGPSYYEFHENAFLPTLLMWLLWAVDGKKYIMMYVMTVLVCIVKEDAPLYVVCIGMYFFFAEKGNIKRLHGIIISVLSGVYMLIMTSWLTKYGDGQMMTSTRFGNLMIDQEGGFKEIIKNVLTDPAYFFSLFIHEDTLNFFLQVMLPLLFLPFFTKKINRFLLMLPFIIMNLVVGAGYGYAANIGFQYIYGPSCLLMYMCIINLEDLGVEKKQDMPVLLGSAAMILTMGTMSHYISYYENNVSNKEYFLELDDMLDRIPTDASVAADTFLLPHIADRDEAYILDNNDINQETGEIIEPERYDFFVVPEGSEIYQKIVPQFDMLGYTLWDEIPGRVAIYKNSSYIG